MAALFVFGGSYLYNHVTDKRETEGSTYSLTRFDYVGAPKHLYGSVARAAGYLDGKRITLTDPAESACTKQCMRSKRVDSVKSNEVFEFCISECRINPLEAGVFDGTTYPELYYGHISDKQSNSTGDLNATKSLRYWLGNSSNDNRVMIDKFMPAFEMHK
ncbi:hypothetical protein I3271_03380 [Photobacterium leiognathi]|uniref:hypothetical protein n=1 Tax=Photobacterium leiognathi TaxID=553611 RepID=UPI001EDE14EB|nr:hypothetical protein [Photobacterium leiognathi]MCG3883723.1 hypothetical protein [Photobacterium leiognathi]